MVLWLQGGPGISAGRAIFSYNGPFTVTPDGALKLREYSFVTNHSVIYIDNPLGAGFSYTTGSEEAYPRESQEVSRQILSFLVQFFEVFPELRTNDFFVGGDSYGGKFSLTTAAEIKSSRPEINLRGVVMGDPVVDPGYQVEQSGYLYALGLIDENERDKMAAIERDFRRWRELYYRSDPITRKSLPSLRDVANNWPLILEYTGLKHILNVLDDQGHSGLTHYVQWINRSDVREALHVGERPFAPDNKEITQLRMLDDLARSESRALEDLLESHRVLIYNGQLDPVIPYASTMKMLRSLKFPGSEEFGRARRKKWRVLGRIAGYWKHAENLDEVLVRGAGHVVTYDRLLYACDLLTRFTRGQRP